MADLRSHLNPELEYLAAIAKTQDWKHAVADERTEQQLKRGPKKATFQSEKIYESEQEQKLAAALSEVELGLEQEQEQDDDTNENTLAARAVNFKELRIQVKSLHNKITKLQDSDQARQQQVSWLMQTALHRDESIRVTRVHALLQQMEQNGCTHKKCFQFCDLSFQNSNLKIIFEKMFSFAGMSHRSSKCQKLWTSIFPKLTAAAFACSL